MHVGTPCESCGLSVALSGGALGLGASGKDLAGFFVQGGQGLGDRVVRDGLVGCALHTMFHLGG